MDKQGRVLVPAYLRDEMGIGTDALVIGVRDHGEIWAPDRWAKYRKAMDDPATFAEAIRGLGICDDRRAAAVTHVPVMADEVVEAMAPRRRHAARRRDPRWRGPRRANPRSLRP